MAIEPNVRRRIVFERAIAAALIKGEAKRQCILHPDVAFHHARHVADVLWPLFTDEIKAIVSQSQGEASVAKA